MAAFYCDPVKADHRLVPRALWQRSRIVTFGASGVSSIQSKALVKRRPV
ncbi:hypothetical protein ACNKHV_03285 [Shigella flexneri]